jgi:cytoskeleton protein RodZ
MSDKNAVGISPVDDANVVTVGKCLQSAREALQLSVEHVANALHITPTYVNLIEKNQFQKLPAAIFTRGYIKSYARLLNLPIDEMMSLYFKQTGDVPIESFIRPAVNEYGVSMRRHALKWAVGMVLVVLLLPTLGWWYAHQDNLEVETVTVSSNEATSSAVESILPLATDKHQTQETITTTSSANEVEMKTDVKTDEEISSATTNIPASAAENKETTSGKLQIKFTGSSWVQVKSIDGKMLHDAGHKEGDNISIEGKSPLYLWVKNAEATTLLFNGEPIKIENQDNKGTARMVIGK